MSSWQQHNSITFTHFLNNVYTYFITFMIHIYLLIYSVYVCVSIQRVHAVQCVRAATSPLGSVSCCVCMTPCGMSAVWSVPLVLSLWRAPASCGTRKSTADRITNSKIPKPSTQTSAGEQDDRCSCVSVLHLVLLLVTVPCESRADHWNMFRTHPAVGYSLFYWIVTSIVSF